MHDLAYCGFVATIFMNWNGYLSLKTSELVQVLHKLMSYRSNDSFLGNVINVFFASAK